MWVKKTGSTLYWLLVNLKALITHSITARTRKLDTQRPELKCETWISELCGRHVNRYFTVLPSDSNQRLNSNFWAIKIGFIWNLVLHNFHLSCSTSKCIHWLGDLCLTHTLSPLCFQLTAHSFPNHLEPMRIEFVSMHIDTPQSFWEKRVVR